MSGVALASVLILGVGSEIVETKPPCGKGNQPPCPDPGDPPACFPTDPTPSFGPPIHEIEAPNSAVFMFGRPLAAAPVGEDIVLAVGARTARLFIYYLDLDAGGNLLTTSFLSPVGGFPVGDSARKLAVADFNGDTFPDFVVSGFGPVELIMSDSGSSTPSYPNSPITILNERGDAIDATDAEGSIPGRIAVGVKGGKKDFGDVHIFDVVAGNPAYLLTVPGNLAPMNEKGGKFGEGVALLDGALGLIVGAPGVNKIGGGRKDTDYGKAFAYDSVFSAPTAAFATGQGKEEKLGWQVAAAGSEVFVATKWSGEDRRVEVYSASPTRTLVPPVSLPIGMGNGWASGGIFTGSVGGVPSVIIGAPNANCAGEGSTGVAYLYVGNSTTPEVFVPPDPVDFSGDTWNAFGWSADIVTAGSYDYVLIGEPGREYDSGDGREGKVYVYRSPPPTP